MSQSDPIMFAARAANMPEAELRAELLRMSETAEQEEWRQAIEDELALRRRRAGGQR